MTAPTIPPVRTSPMHFGLERGGTSASTANLKLWPAAAGSPSSALLTQSAPKDSVAHATAAKAPADDPPNATGASFFDSISAFAAPS